MLCLNMKKLVFKHRSHPSENTFFFKNNSICAVFGCAASLLLRRLFSSCSQQGLFSSCLAQSPHHRGFSCCRARGA